MIVISPMTVMQNQMYISAVKSLTRHFRFITIQTISITIVYWGIYTTKTTSRYWRFKK